MDEDGKGKVCCLRSWSSTGGVGMQHRRRSIGVGGQKEDD